MDHRSLMLLYKKVLMKGMLTSVGCLEQAFISRNIHQRVTNMFMVLVVVLVAPSIRIVVVILVTGSSLIFLLLSTKLDCFPITKKFYLNVFFVSRHLLLCRVTLGKSFLQFSAMKMAHAPPGHHSVAGRPSTGGLNFPEYVVYRGEQAYPEYFITYQIVKPEEGLSSTDSDVR